MTQHSSPSANKSPSTWGVHLVSENAPKVLTPTATILKQGGVLLSLTDDFHIHMPAESTLLLSELLFEAAMRDADVEAMIDWEDEADQ